MPVFDLSRILEWVKNVAADLIKWLAFRAFMLSLVLVALPIAIYNAWLMIQEELGAWLMNNVFFDGDMFDGVVLTFDGFAAWLGGQLMLPECLSILMAGLMVRFTLGMLKL